MQNASWGFAAGLLRLPETSEAEWLEQLHDHHVRCMRMPASDEQDRAWRETRRVLVAAVAALRASSVGIENWAVVAEYELPRERGRRPDVVILADDRILVLEFKLAPVHGQPAIDQVRAYVRDLQAYHSATHGRHVIPVVVTSGRAPVQISDGDVLVTPGEKLAKCIGHALERQAPANFVNGVSPGVRGWESERDALARAIGWCNGTYAPLPSLVDAARAIFRAEPLPAIRHAHSAGIPEALASLIEIIERASRDGTRNLALLTGVPGSGKTLTGLQLVFSDAVAAVAGDAGASFLSGNGPLVAVLQHALSGSARGSNNHAGRVFVRDVHGFLKAHGAGARHIPHERVLVFDDAQRAWDAAQVGSKRGTAVSEPEDFLRTGSRVPGWSVMVGLIGEGQEIHVGEESGLGQWDDAVAKLASEGVDWLVHCPSNAKEHFSRSGAVKVHEALNLTASLRSHLALDLHRWAGHLLEGDLQAASTTARDCIALGFDLYVTDDIDKARRYAQARYVGQPDKRYGLLASHRATSLACYGFDVGWNASRALSNRIGRWFNDEPESCRSCRNLLETATEFQCQGLELDLPIVGWADDLQPISDNAGRSSVTWVAKPGSTSRLRNPQAVWRNKYRVLLTRGRDGLVVFVPPKTPGTLQALLNAGMQKLDEWNLCSLPEAI